MQNEFPIDLFGQFVTAIGVFIQHGNIGHVGVNFPGTGEALMRLQQRIVGNIALRVLRTQTGANHCRLWLDRDAE